MTPSEWAVLALLAEGPNHGFAIARAIADDGEIAERLQPAVHEAEGFDQTLLKWRLETAAAALRFIDAIVDGPSRGRR